VEIRLTYISGSQVRGELSIPDSVAHFGRNVPPGKRGVVLLEGENIAPHHGKIIYAYGTYRYVNLTEKTTEVFRGESFLFELDPLMPSCTVLEGDRLKFGTAIVQITRLVPPLIVTSPQRSLPVLENLNYLPLDCDRCELGWACEVDRISGELVPRLHDYMRPHEILRASVDWLRTLFGNWRQGSQGLRLARPDAIAIWPRKDAVPLWEDFHLPVPDRPTVEETAPLKDVPAEQLDQGRSFLICDQNREPKGIGAGIVEEVVLTNGDQGNGLPRAGHYLVVKYPPKEKPGRDDLCVVQHTVVNISAALASVEAAVIRRERTMEIWAAKETRGLFHDMRNCCTGGEAVIRAIQGAADESVQAELRKVLDCLKMLYEMVLSGETLFDCEPESRLDYVDLPELCRGTLGFVFPERQWLRQSRDWRVEPAEPPSKLKHLPGDMLGIQRVLLNLVHNSSTALDRRKNGPEIRRVYVFLAVAVQDDLPYARIRVADDGCGLDSDARRALFEGRFPARPQGHGLGSRVVADQVRKHYGFLEVASDLQVGTVVTVLLPLPKPSTEGLPAHSSEALSSYRDRSLQHPLVQSRSLKSLRDKDPEVNAFYCQ
jgi:hypothetical protein